MICGHCIIDIDGPAQYIPECCDKPVCQDCFDKQEREQIAAAMKRWEEGHRRAHSAKEIAEEAAVKLPELLQKHEFTSLSDATLSESGDLRVDLWYPPRTTKERVNPYPKVNRIFVGLMDVRAADDIQIEYDFDRDGYVIRQSDNKDDGVEETWREAAFVKAWQFTERDQNGELL